VALPFSPLAEPLGLTRPRPAVLALIALIVSTYIFSAEGLKRWFFRKANTTPGIRA
jgi:hypothetical protein